MSTACEKCVYYDNRGKVEPWISSWDFQRCIAGAKNQIFDPITGKTTKTDAYCKDVNKGNCDFFKEK